MSDLISRQSAIDELVRWRKIQDYNEGEKNMMGCVIGMLSALPSTQPEYEPVNAEDFAKTMSENSFYNFVTWHQEALTLMERHGFVICKKTM